MKPIVEVQSLSKVYAIKRQKQTYPSTIRDGVTSLIDASLRFLQASRAESEKLWALSKVSFKVSQGEVVGIIGRNGSGKSTLLKILSRIVEPTGGEARLRGRTASLLEIGTGFHPELSGRENVFLNGALLGMRRREIVRQFDEIVDFSGIERFLDTPVKFYSSGMYVRLAFAVAAHLAPDILLVDEVLAVGDAEFQKKSLGKMRATAGDGRTVLFVSHNMQSIAGLCKRGLLLDAGELAAEGPIHHVISAYQDQVSSAAKPPELRRSIAEQTHIKRVWIEDGRGKKVDNIVSGQPASLCAELFVMPELQGKDLNIGFGVDSETGLRIFTTTSGWAGNEIIAPGEGLAVCCSLRSFPLVSGSYSIATSISYLGETIDHAQNLAQFYVLPKQGSWGSCRTPDQGHVDLACAFDGRPL